MSRSAPHFDRSRRANDAVIALGLKGGKTHSMILRQETPVRQPKQEPKEKKPDPVTAQLAKWQEASWQQSKKSWERSKQQWRQLTGAKEEPSAPAAASETTAP